jgi:hypothetical protein
MSKQNFETLLDPLACEDLIRCQKIRRSLVKLGHQAVPSLLEALGSKKNWVRWEAAKALAQIGDPAATRPLIRSLEDKKFDVRWLAAEGLIAIGKQAVVPLLRALVDNPKSIWLREGAHHVMHDMDRGDWDEILRPVMKAIEGMEPSLEVPEAAEKVLNILENQVP